MLTTVILANTTMETNAVYDYATQAELDLTATKLMVAGSLEDFAFTFDLIDENGNTVSTGTSDSDGAIVFNPVYYNNYNDGEVHIYTVVEREDYGGINYAPSKTVTVTIHDNGEGTLNLATVWENNNSVFMNTFLTGGLPGAGNTNWMTVVLSLMFTGLLLEVAYSIAKRSKK